MEDNPFRVQAKIINNPSKINDLLNININENIIGRHEFNKGHTIGNDLQQKVKKMEKVRDAHS